jgi:hypothetical protein
MNDGFFAFRADLEAALLKHFQHGDILGQDLGDQFAQTGLAGDGCAESVVERPLTRSRRISASRSTSAANGRP